MCRVRKQGPALARRRSRVGPARLPRVARTPTTNQPNNPTRKGADEPDFIVVRGARGAQPDHRSPADPEAAAGRLHGGVRIGKIVAGVRHAVRRRATAVRRIAVVVRAPVSGPDGKAEVRTAARAVAHHRHRTEVGVVEPAVDGRDGDRDLRLPARPVRARRRAALSSVRRRGDRPVGGRNRHRADDVAAEDQGGPDGAQGGQPQGRVPRGVRGGAQGRVRARAHQRPHPAPGGRDRSRQEEEAHHRDRDRPRDHRSRGTRAHHRFGRDRRQGGRRIDCRRGGGRGARTRLQRGARLPELRRRIAGAVAAVVFVQQPAGHVRRLQRAGRQPGDRRRSDRPQPRPVDRGRRDRALGRSRRQGKRVDRQHRVGGVARIRDPARQAVEEPDAAAARGAAVRRR